MKTHRHTTYRLEKGLQSTNGTQRQRGCHLFTRQFRLEYTPRVKRAGEKEGEYE
jgi:hypothetical protein